MKLKILHANCFFAETLEFVLKFKISGIVKDNETKGIFMCS